MIHPAPPPPVIYSPPARQPTIIHIDDSLIVVDKPTGLLSVPGRGPAHADSLASRIQSLYPEALIVHRLDMATSGLIVMARGKDMERRLSIAFQQRQVFKRYVAVVAGRPDPAEGEVDLPLVTDWPNRPRQKVDHATGKASLTRYAVMPGQDGPSSRVWLYPHTGRSHQLRVHMLAIGHPILGDELYAPSPWREAAPRLLLHAERLALPHPLDGRRLELESSVPF